MTTYPPLFGILLVLLCCLPSCAFSDDIEITRDHYWTEDAQAIAERNGVRLDTYWWSFRRMEKGDSLLVHLYKRRFRVGSYDGQSYYRVVFQLPAEVEKGQEFELKPIPRNRKAEQDQEGDFYGIMQDGEIAAMKFGNPRYGVIDAVEEAKVTILSRKGDELVLSLVFKAETARPHEGFTFDIQQTFTLKHKAMTETD